MKNLILIVNYKKEIFETDTIKNLLKYNDTLIKNYDIFIWDNCALKENQKIANYSENITYLAFDGNETLARIYNKMIREKIHKYDYFIIFDNDSKVGIEYFLEFEKSLKINSEISLFVPKIINADNQVRSPRKIEIKLFGYKEDFLSIDYKGKLKSNELFAANSGMIIKVDYLKRFKGYDERLKFYGTDDYFMKQYEKSNEYCYVLDYVMPHEFALNKLDEPIEKQIWRYRDCQNGLFIRRKEYSKLMQLRILISQLKSGICKSIKNKNMGYFKSILQIWLKRY